MPESTQIPDEVATIVGLDHINHGLVERQVSRLNAIVRQQQAEIERLRKQVAALSQTNGEEVRA